MSDIMSSSPGTHVVEEKVGHPAGYPLTATHLPPCPLPHPGSPTRIQKAREREKRGGGRSPAGAALFSETGLEVCSQGTGWLACLLAREAPELEVGVETGHEMLTLLLSGLMKACPGFSPGTNCLSMSPQPRDPSQGSADGRNQNFLSPTGTPSYASLIKGRCISGYFRGKARVEVELGLQWVPLYPICSVLPSQSVPSPPSVSFCLVGAGS